MSKQSKQEELQSLFTSAMRMFIMSQKEEKKKRLNELWDMLETMDLAKRYQEAYNKQIMIEINKLPSDNFFEERRKKLHNLILKNFKRMVELGNKIDIVFRTYHTLREEIKNG
jgi:DNA-binding transcriptional regulator PaaX